MDTLKQTLLVLANIGWNKDHDNCFDHIKSTLQNLITLAHIKDDYRLCVFPNAFKDFWAIMLTQTPTDNLSKPVDQQRHELLTCLSVSFRGSQIDRATIEKEAYRRLPPIQAVPDW